MKWTAKQPAAGDMIRVRLGNIYHYGVYASRGEVIQFGLAPCARPHLKDSEIEVCASDLDTFLCGGQVEVAEPEQGKDSVRSPEQAVSYARQSLGRRGYHLLKNNCEHFAYECVTGKPYCSQTADVRALFRSLPIVDVYVAAVSSDTALTPCSQALTVYALERTFGLRAEQMDFVQTAPNAWTCEKCSFSIAHCSDVMAVAVSRASVSVHIEPADATPAYVLPDGAGVTQNVTVEGSAYRLSVATDTPQVLRSYIGIKLP